MTLPTPIELDGRNPDSAHFWAGLREHRVLVQRCGSCGSARLPPMPGCPVCGSDRAHVVECTGRGVIYSYVDLDEGARIFGRLVGGGRAEIGDRVEACFVEHREWTELRFRLGEAP